MCDSVVNSAESFLKRYDVMTSTGWAGPDGAISHTEMNRVEVARALQTLPDADFARVWDTLSDSAKLSYFRLNYPDLPGRVGLICVWDANSPQERAAIVRTISNRRDLARFAELNHLLDSGRDYDTLVGMWVYKKHEEALRVEARRVISGGPVSPNAPALDPPRGR